MAHTLQERYSNLVLAKLRQENVLMNLMNRKYEGDPKAGAVKIPVRDTEVVAGAYTKASGKALTIGATTYKTLEIGNDIAVNEIIDGYDAAAVPDGLVADRLDSAGYSLALTIDTAIATLLTTSGKYTAEASTTASTASTIYKNIVGSVKNAKKAGVQKSAMWIVVTPDVMELLETADLLTHSSTQGDAVITNGFAGRLNGVPVYESLNATLDTAKVEYIVGNNEFCHFVSEFTVPVQINDLTNEYIGAAAVQGRVAYGLDVTRPTTVIAKLHA